MALEYHKTSIKNSGLLIFYTKEEGGISYGGHCFGGTFIISRCFKQGALIANPQSGTSMSTLPTVF